MKIKILKCSIGSAYSSAIGKICKVTGEDEKYYFSDGMLYAVLKTDCKIVDEPETGLKYDTEKTRFELLPFEQIEQVAEVLTLGAKKYKDDNWKHVKPRSRYIGACLRHIFAWLKGEKLDPETNKSHLAHAVCCLLFLMCGDDNDERTN